LVSVVAAVRLVDLQNSMQGRVEVIPKNYSTVCDYNWNINGAAVVCRELGYVQGFVLITFMFSSVSNADVQMYSLIPSAMSILLIDT
jgi:hypothetical protein